MKLINKFVDKALSLLMEISAAVLFVVTLAQVITRFVFKLPIPWSSDIIRLTFIYAIFFGAGYVAQNNGHLNLDLLLSSLKPRARVIADVVLFIILTAFCGFLCYISTQFTIISGGTQRFPYLSIPMTAMYVAIPIGTGIMTFYYVQFLVKSIRQLISGSTGKVEE